MTKFLYQGHASFRIVTDNGSVIYVDPYVGDGYDIPADIVLITHQHGDHNQLKLVTQAAGCRIITNKDALANGKHNKFSLKDIEIEAVTAENANHDPKQCVGYIITAAGIKIYAAGDTSKTKQMYTFTDRSLDYALLACDGVYNMGPDEAAGCAQIIGARHNIPIHMSPGALFNQEAAEKFNAPNRLIIEPGQEISL